MHRRPLRTVPHHPSIHKTIAILRAMAFIGRERELSVLGAALQRAGDSELTRVAISGPLGIGITRLLDELEARLAKAKDSGVVVLRARCLEPAGGVAYSAIRSALGDAFIGVSAD